MRTLRHPLTLLALVSGTSSWAADSLESLQVDSVEAVERCFAIVPYVIEHRGADGTVTRHFIDEIDIWKGCTEKAVALARAKSGDVKTLFALAEEVRRGYRQEASLKIFKIAVDADASRALCDDSKIYAAIIAALSRPAGFPSRSDADVTHALAVVDSCLSSKQFASDIKEELDTGKPHVAENLCPLLQKKHLVEKCPK